MVRQYTQFMALMNNYDTFKENLDTAYGSEGTLQEQADIYAESWEAARDRVRAAAENIYDSLINADTFIGLDNVVTPVLNRIADIADAMGGLKGVMITLGYAATTLFKDQIAQGLRDAQYNIKQLTGLAAEEDKQFRSLAADMAATMAISSQDSEIQLLAKKVQMENQIYEVSEQMNASQVRAATAEKENVLSLMNLAESLQTTANESNTAIEQEVKQISNLGLKIKDVTSIKIGNITKDLGVSGALTDVQKLATGYETLSKKATQIQSVKSIYTGLIKNTSEADKQTQEYKNTLTFLQEQLNNLGIKNVNLGLKDSTAVLKQLDQAAQETEVKFQQFDKLLIELEKTSGQDKEVIQQLREQLDALRDSIQNAANAMNNGAIVAQDAEGKFNNFGQTLEGIINRQKDWADQVVTVSNKLMSLGMAISSVQTLGRVFTDEDMTATERITQGLTAVAMILPMVASGYKTLQAAEKAATAGTIANKAAESESVIVKGAATAATKVLTAASKSLVATLLLEAAIIGAVVLAVVGIVKLVDNLTNSQKNAAEATETAAENYETEKEKLEELNSELEETQSQIDELNSKDSLTIVEQEELNKLQKEVELLEAKQKIQEKITEQAEKENLASIAENYDAEYQPETYENNTTRADTSRSRKEVGKKLGNTDLKNYLPAYQSAYSDSEAFKEAITNNLDDALKAGELTAEEYNVLLRKVNTYTKDWLSEEQAADAAYIDDVENAHAAYRDEVSEDYQALLDDYYTYMSAVATGTITEDPSVSAGMREKLAEYRKGMYGDEDYFEFVIKPVIEDSDFTDIKNQIYADLMNGDESAVFNLLNTDEATDILNRYGVTAEEVFNKIKESITTTKENLIEAVGSDEESLKELNDYLITISAEDWTILATLDLEGVENLDDLMAKLSAAKAESSTIDYQSSASSVGDILNSYAEGNRYEDFDSDQLAFLSELEERYTKLGEIQDKNSHQYLEALRQIQEFEEGNAKDELIAVGDEQLNKINKLKEEVQDLQKEWQEAADAGRDTTAIDVKLELKTDELDDAIADLEDTKIKIQAQVEVDVNSDIDQAFGLAEEFDQLSDVLTDDLKYTVEEAQTLIEQGYADMFANCTATTDGMIQANKAAAVAAVEARQTELEASKESTLQQLKNEYEKGVALETAYRNMAEAYASAAAATDETSYNTAMDVVSDRQKELAAAQSAYYEAASANDDSNSDITTNTANAVNDVNTSYSSISTSASKNFSSASTSANQHASDAVKAAAAVGQAWAAAYQAAETGEYTGPTDYSGSNTVSNTAGSTEKVSSSYSKGNISGSSSGDTSGITSLTNSLLNQTGRTNSANKAGLSSASATANAAADAQAKTNAALQVAMAAVEGASNNLADTIKNAGSGSGSNKSGSGSGSGSSKDPDVEELKTEAGERYHDINRQLEKQADLLDLIDENAERAYGTDRLAYYKQYQEELDDEIDLYNKKLEQAQGYLDSDKKLIAGLGLNVKYDSETNEITNYDEVQEYIKKTYNDFMTSYNAMTADQQDNAKTQLDAMKKWYSNAQDYLGNYEDTLDVIKETTDGIRDDTRKKLDSVLTSLNYKLQIKLDAKENLKAYSDFQKTIAESYGDSLTHGLSSMAYAADNARTEAEISKTFESQANELIDAWNNATTDTNKDEIRSQMNDLLDEIISSGESILDSIEEFENGFADALDAASERFSQFTDTLDHNSAISDTIKEIMTLQGVSLKTAQGFDAIQSTYNSKMQASWVKAKLQKEWLDDLENMLATAEANLAGVDEADASYDMLKNQYDALLTEYQDTQEAMLEATQETMETAQAIFENAVERAGYKLEQALTSNKGFTLLQMQYDNFIDTDERYLDEVNKLYEVTTLTNKIQSSIDESNSKAAAATLKALKDEYELRAQNNKLSQYDIDVMNAKYEMTLKQIALEEAQNNKSSLALMRDDQGNWTYKYTADQSEIDQANQDYLDAANNYYNIAKDQVKEVTGDIIDTWQEMTDKIKEIYTDESLTVDEREAQIAEIREYYAQKIKDLEEEKQQAIDDMTEAGTITIQNFDNDYGLALDSMTSNTTTFEGAFDEAIEEMENASNDYKDTIIDVNKDTGTSYDDLTEQIDDTTAATEKVKEAGEIATDSMNANLNSIQAQTDHYKELAETLYDVVNAYQQVSSSIVNVTTQDFFDDYSTKMLEAWRDAGYSTSSELYSKWADQRTIKGWKDTELSNNEITDLLNQYDKDEAITNYIDKVLDGQAYFTYADRKEYAKFDTGGYTGDFEGGKLALLHQKELVLNAEDTSNILSAVTAVRSLGANVLQSIVEALDSTASAGLGLMAARVNSTSSVSTSGNTLEQQVHIEATFPNVTSSNEIEEALKNLTNEAIQYVNINR